MLGILATVRAGAAEQQFEVAIELSECLQDVFAAVLRHVAAQKEDVLVLLDLVGAQDGIRLGGRDTRVLDGLDGRPVRYVDGRRPTVERFVVVVAYRGGIHHHLVAETSTQPRRYVNERLRDPPPLLAPPVEAIGVQRDRYSGELRDHAQRRDTWIERQHHIGLLSKHVQHGKHAVRIGVGGLRLDAREDDAPHAAVLPD